MGRLVISESMVVGSNVRIRWWEGQPMDGFQMMGRQWVGGSAMGGLAAVVGGCMRCGGSVGRWWVVFFIFVFVFIFLFWWL